jgi:MSHA biogenesis protein MshN
MSLINQVLNELESRGANVPLGESTIRAVPARKQSHAMRYIFLALTLLILLAALKWYLGRADTHALEQSVVATAPMNGAVLAISDVVSAPVTVYPASSGADAASTLNMSHALNSPPLSASRRDKPLIEVQREEVAVAVPEVKQSARRRSKQISEQTVENVEDIPTENPVNLQLKKITPQQRAESEFRKANLALQEGRTNDALAGYENALLSDSSNKEARRAWVGLLLSLKRNDDAENVLRKGLKRDPHDASFAMLMARLQVERGAVPLALETLQKTLPSAEGQADYQAFMAALLQRQSRHDEAIAHYQIALKSAPNNGIWLMGLGISLQALQRNEDARDAYRRALASNSLNAQLQAYVQQKLKEL